MATPAPITPGQLSDWAFETAEYTGDETPPTFVAVRGITEFTPPAIEKNQEDDGDFDGGVWSSSTSTGLGYKVEGTVKIPRGGLAKDPGQEILRAAGIGVAEEGYVHWRAYDKRSGDGWEGIADSTFTENGGPKTDLKTAAFSLTGRGELLPYTREIEGAGVQMAKTVDTEEVEPLDAEDVPADDAEPVDAEA